MLQNRTRLLIIAVLIFHHNVPFWANRKLARFAALERLRGRLRGFQQFRPNFRAAFSPHAQTVPDDDRDQRKGEDYR